MNIVIKSGGIDILTALIAGLTTPATVEPTTSATEEPGTLTPDEQIATPPSKPEEPIVQVDPEPTKPAPTAEPNVEPRPDEGKNPDGYDGEIIEIIDED